MGSTQDQERIVSLLQDDIRGEHAAIVQYLQHAYRLGESGAAGEVEEIARDEMRHFHWLSQKVVELGGDPTLEPGPVLDGRSSPSALMQVDADTEAGAISRYEEHVRGVSDPDLVALLERILVDERAHRVMFADLAGELDGLRSAGSDGPVGRFGAGEINAEISAGDGQDGRAPGTDSGVGEANAPGQEMARTTWDKPDPIHQMLEADARREYETILQYLHQSLVTPDCLLSRDLLVNISQWEMKHLGWLLEELAERGGEPSFERGPLKLVYDTVAMIQADLTGETEAQARYGQEREHLSDPELVALFGRMREHERYHLRELGLLLTRLTVARPAGSESPCVGRQAE